MESNLRFLSLTSLFSEHRDQNHQNMTHLKLTYLYTFLIHPNHCVVAVLKAQSAAVQN